MTNKPVIIGETLKAVLKNLGMERIMKHHSIRASWQEIVGPEVASHTYPEFLSGKTLFVLVDQSGWMHQLTFLKDQILSKIHLTLETRELSEIQFRLGILPSEKQAANTFSSPEFGQAPHRATPQGRD